MTTHTSDSIITTIKEKNIRPKSRIYFMVTHAALWVPGVMVTLLGAFAVAGIIFAVTHVGYEYREFVYPTEKDFVLAAIPYIWVISYIFFALLIVHALRTTHSGYRLSLPVILLSSVSVSVLLGAGIYAADSVLNVDKVVRYPVHMREQKNWNSPLQGRLAGEILSQEMEILILLDKEGNAWTVDISGLGTTTLPFIAVGKSIRIVGKNTEGYQFVACAVFPWDIGMFPRQEKRPGEIYPPMMTPPQEKPFGGKEECRDLLESMKKDVRREN